MHAVRLLLVHHADEHRQVEVRSRHGANRSLASLAVDRLQHIETRCAASGAGCGHHTDPDKRVDLGYLRYPDPRPRSTSPASQRATGARLAWQQWNSECFPRVYDAAMTTNPAVQTSRLVRVLASILVIVAVFAHQWHTWRWARWLTAVSFGGSIERIEHISAAHPHGSGGAFTGDVLLTTALLIVASCLTAWALRVWWDYGWRSAAHRKGRRFVPLVPLCAAVFGLVEAVLALCTVSEADNSLSVSNDWVARVLAASGQMKWLACVVSGGALFFTLYGAWRFHAFSLEPIAPPASATVGDRHKSSSKPLKPSGSAICLSGGGIRSAAFAWGGLAGLEGGEENTPNRLTSFDRIYSVSGGGYAATSLSAATDPTPVAPYFNDGIGAVGVGAVDTGNLTRFDYFLNNSRYLASGAGGLPRALLLALLSVAFNLFTVFLGIVVIAIPIGLLARNELGGGGELPSGALGWPIAIAASLALVPLAVRMGLSLRSLNPRPPGRPFVVVGLGLAAGAGALALVRLGLPWVAERTGSLFTGGWWASVLPAAVVWILGLLFAAVRPRLTKSAARLGGVVTVGAMIGAAVLVLNAIGGAGERWKWASSGSLLADFRWMLLIAVVALIVIDVLGVQWWSLHPIYRNRLANTFLFQQVGLSSVLEPQPRSEWATFTQVVGRMPVPVVCAATHRRANKVTGLKSISFTFSPEGVSMFEPVLNDENRVAVNTYRQPFSVSPAGQTTSAVGTRPDMPIITAAAISGAAFNSVMGRHSQGSTDTLLALLNLRLGVWLPNPRYNLSGRLRPRAGLRYLFHEVIGHFDITDPFVHVSDGGHWENLGLVEALRARHKRIVCIDASGDHFAPATVAGPATGLATLYEAIDLARIELATEVRVLPAALDMMRPDSRTGRCERNWMVCKVIFHHDAEHNWETECTSACHKAELLFVKALVCDRTPENVLAFANTDRIFPNYSTGDQFLEPDQVRSLVGLGKAAVRDALQKLPDGWVPGDATGYSAQLQS